MVKTLQVMLLVALGLLLLAGGFFGGFIAGHVLPFSSLSEAGLPVGLPPVLQAPTVPAAANTATPADLQDLFKPF